MVIPSNHSYRKMMVASNRHRWAFTAYDQIPHNIVTEICGVAGVYHISDLELGDINDYLNGLNDYLDNRN